VSLERTIASLHDVVERRIRGLIRRKMDEVYRTAGCQSGRESGKGKSLVVHRVYFDLSDSSINIRLYIQIF